MQFSSIRSECMEINGKFLVGFRNYNKDKQVSVIVCENSINSIVNESLNSSFIKVDLDYYYIQGLGFLVRRRTRKPSFFLQLTVELTVQIYYCPNYNSTDKKVLFLQQVDDFSVACKDEETAKHVIHSINLKMTIQDKLLGLLIHQFNRVNVLQTHDYVKIYNSTYITKILQHHRWLVNATPLSLPPTPMLDDSEYQCALEDATPLMTAELNAIEDRLGFSYCQAIGELIYALITCRPDISFACIKLSQYSAKPASIHFDAVECIYQ